MSLDEDGNPYIGVPRLVAGLTGHHIVSVSCGLEHVLAATDKGAGSPTPTNPSVLPLARPVTRIDRGTPGELFSWGGAIYGRLGHGPDMGDMPVDEDGGPVT